MYGTVQGKDEGRIRTRELNNLCFADSTQARARAPYLLLREQTLEVDHADGRDAPQVQSLGDRLVVGAALGASARG